MSNVGFGKSDKNSRFYSCFFNQFSKCSNIHCIMLHCIALQVVWLYGTQVGVLFSQGGLSDGSRSQFDQDIDFSGISFYHEKRLHVNLFPGNLFGSE